MCMCMCIYRNLRAQWCLPQDYIYMNFWTTTTTTTTKNSGRDIEVSSENERRMVRKLYQSRQASRNISF